MVMAVISYVAYVKYCRMLLVIPYTLQEASSVAHLERANGFHLP